MLLMKIDSTKLQVFLISTVLIWNYCHVRLLSSIVTKYSTLSHLVNLWTRVFHPPFSRYSDKIHRLRILSTICTRYSDRACFQLYCHVRLLLSNVISTILLVTLSFCELVYFHPPFTRYFDCASFQQYARDTLMAHPFNCMRLRYSWWRILSTVCRL